MNIFYQTMRHLRPLFFGLPLLIAASTVGSCSGDIADNFTSAPSLEPAAPVDSILKFATIEDFEAMTASEIPGDYAAYKLNSLTYECVDTIEFRALLFDVTAQLTSPAGAKKDVIFKAEVGPELVSVEYEPLVTVTPAHDDLYTAYWAKVERYRNYSDGSRIGPDTFYDYGHPFFPNMCMLQQYCTYLCQMDPSYSLQTGDKLEYLNFSDYEYYENGVFNFDVGLYELDLNLNAEIIMEDGTTFTGDDFMIKEAHHLSSSMLPYEWDAAWSPIEDNYFSYVRGNYYMETKDNVWAYNYECPVLMDDPHDEDEYALIVNLCRDVPDVSDTPFPKDVKALKEGWYFTRFTDFHRSLNYYHSNYTRYYREMWDFKPSDITCSYWFTFNPSYLVIDGRIIHFEEWLKNYKGPYATPKNTVTKTNEGYIFHTEVDDEVYGVTVRSKMDFVVRGVRGPHVVYDMSEYGKLEENDTNELNNLSNTRSIESNHPSYKQPIPREDGKIFEFDRNLPKSIGRVSRTRTIYPQNK